MRQSELYIKTFREAPKDEEAISAKLLIQAGFINKEMAGVYTYLPLGLKVMRKIENIVREGIEKVGGREILMPVLHPKENWVKTGRWTEFDVLYKFDQSGKDDGVVANFALGATHEEIITPLLQKNISSYRDLPTYLYQIQTKFRNEPRAKSGILRGKEFIMKDLYSFHATPEDLEKFYETMKEAYRQIFERIGLKTLVTKASGGTFSKYSHEFQVLADAGEDTVFYCLKCDFAENKEVTTIKNGDSCPQCGDKTEVSQAIEVGNIFKLGTRFSEAFNLTYRGASGKEKLVYMGCYGIGISRTMGVIVEVSNDDKGIIWPESVAPFKAHLIELKKGLGRELYGRLTKAGVEVLYDDRDLTPGEKFNDADLIGIPWRLVISDKTKNKVEIKKRGGKSIKLVSHDGIIQQLS